MIKTISLLGLMLLTIGYIELLRFPTTNTSSPTILTTPGTTSFPRQLRDAAGETLIISSPPQRIVSQTLATDEMLLALCPLKRIAAVSTLAQNATYSNVVTQARQVATLPTGNVEQIVALKPDLILVASYNRAETIELLKTTGAPVFHLANFDSLADIKSNIRTIGYLIGEEQRAASLLAQMERDLNEIRAHLPKGRKPPRVLSYSIDNYTAGAHTTFDDMVKWVKAINVATEQGIEQHAQINEEQILAWQPDVIVTPAAQTEFTQIRQQLLEKPAIAASKAGQTGRIIVIDNRYVMPVSQYIVYGIKALAEKLYD
jgi:iron complex transport system substrate-binding protein